MFSGDGVVRALNKTYWEGVSPESIIGRNAFPAVELFSRIPHGASVLDLGCGTGEIADFLSERAYNVTGMDLNPEAIARNVARSGKTRYLLGDVTERLPFAEGSIDAVVMAFVLVNVICPAQRKGLAEEVARVLRPGGVAWVNEALVSDDYAERYELCAPFLGNEHDFFVFREGTLSSSVKTGEALRRAIRDGQVARVAHHFRVEELRQLFGGFDVLSEDISETKSAHTRSAIRMVTAVYGKK